MDVIQQINPIWVSIGLGCALGAGLILALWKGFDTIAVGAKWIKERVFTFTCFFWVVNIVCMAYSAQNAGYIFGLYESTGLLVGVALDLLIVAFTQTMLAAKARGESDRALKILLFIVACCLLSTIGNLAHNLHTNIDQQTSGVWFQQIIPYAVSVMPLFLIALAYVADLKVSPIGSMSLEKYKELEQKRLDFVDEQLNSRDREEKQRTRRIAIDALARQNKQLQRGKGYRSFRWWWETRIPTADIVAGVFEQVKAYHVQELKEVEKQKVLALQDAAYRQKQLEDYIAQLLTQIHEKGRQEKEEYRREMETRYRQDMTSLSETIIGQIGEGLETRYMADEARVIGQESAPISSPLPAPHRTDSLASDPMTIEAEKHYPIVASWLSRKERSVTIEEVIQGTGHSPQMVHKRAKDGTFRKTRREGHYTLSSVITWLSSAPLPKAKEREKEPITGEMEAVKSNGNGHITTKLDDLVELTV